MRPQSEAARLVSVGERPDGGPLQLEPETAQSWLAMRAAAAADGVGLVLVSAFRSVERQRQIVAAKLAAGRTLEEILRVSAYPGYSEHHTGRAVDVTSPGCAALTEEFEGTAAFRWLMEHAERFGFALSYPRGNPTGVAYEPWHWCHDGRTRPNADGG